MARSQRRASERGGPCLDPYRGGSASSRAKSPPSSLALHGARGAASVRARSPWHTARAALLLLPEAVGKRFGGVDIANGDDELTQPSRSAVTRRAETAGSLEISNAAK